MQPKVHAPVRLSEGKVESFSDAANIAFEYAVFFDWIYFKNRPRGNLLFARALLIVAVVSALFFEVRHDFELVLLGIDVDPVILFGAMTVFGYAAMLRSFYRKSEACNKVYVEMLKAEGEGKDLTAALLKNYLAIELLTMDLWAHRSYRAFFARSLEQAVRHACHHDNPESWGLPKSPEEMMKMINEGRFQAKEARWALDCYHEWLLNQAARRHGMAPEKAA